MVGSQISITIIWYLNHLQVSHYFDTKVLLFNECNFYGSIVGVIKVMIIVFDISIVQNVMGEQYLETFEFIDPFQ